ncbi:hypothetical protein KY290_032243 [Solanum tuberosum]|uniref:Uncharacterized protein n=1 Tax=Solanum tuberosum TaxID=4113 RepID=A0ABQ7UBK9_SOLTU|nr:hypothetical protein KY290_032243 [Solanum tuberosum]
MPALSFKFNSTDPLSGDEVDDQAQFISSVCWRGQSSTLVAANSMDVKGKGSTLMNEWLAVKRSARSDT